MAQFDKSKSMVEIATEYVKLNGKQNIYNLLNEVAKIKEIDEDNVDKLSQLYLDMTLSANFVYCGNDEWDLKENNLDLWDKDGSFFNKDEVYEDDEEDDGIQLEDYFIQEEVVLEAIDDDEENEDLEAKIDEEDEIVIDDHIKVYSTDDEDEVVDLDFDDDDYNEIMDDYEDMYDE